MQSGAALDAIPVLQQGKGTVAFQLKATVSNHEEVLDVQVCQRIPQEAFSAEFVQPKSLLLYGHCSACCL